jgi:hypothetical protein
MSYDTNWAKSSNDGDIRRLKKEADKLARIACRALQALEDMGKEDFLLLKDDEIRTWWSSHKEADRVAREAERAKQERKEAKERILARLTEEEKILLGLKKK